MSLARVVTFDGVTKERADAMREQVSGDPPEGLKATEFLLLHDAEAERATAVLFFDNDEDYRQGDQILNAMSSDETPGNRTSVTKTDVILRMTV